ncbi:unnamed protein product, partial [Amoebophrya sp. A25]|eukprot:GSA25T00015332001.1
MPKGPDGVSKITFGGEGSIDEFRKFFSDDNTPSGSNSTIDKGSGTTHRECRVECSASVNITEMSIDPNDPSRALIKVSVEYRKGMKRSDLPYMMVEMMALQMDKQQGRYIQKQADLNDTKEAIYGPNGLL